MNVEPYEKFVLKTMLLCKYHAYTEFSQGCLKMGRNSPFRKHTETKTCRTVLDLKLHFINDGTLA